MTTAVVCLTKRSARGRRPGRVSWRKAAWFSEYSSMLPPRLLLQVPVILWWEI
ncbi:unnamed protein product [Ectocarpus sp. 12 AP-2014]